MKIICYGDSNTWGFDPRGPFGGRYHTIWTEVLAMSSSWNVINQGENGREIPRRCVSFPLDTDLLIIMLGTNDLLQFRSPEDVCEKTKQFLALVNLEYQKILLIAPPPLVFGEWVENQSLINNSVLLANQYHILSQSMDVRYADAGQWNVPIAFDGVHFTEEGHRRFADGLYNYLNKGK